MKAICTGIGITHTIIYIILNATIVKADSAIDAEEHASKQIIQKCDSMGRVISESKFADELKKTAELTVKDKENILVNGDTLCAMIVGCLGLGEFILLDRDTGGQVLGSIELTIPGMHAQIETTKDINNDGFDEVILKLSGGAHGLYTYFLSVYDDSLSFVINPSGGNSFFAIRGDVYLKDFDGDNIYEIVEDGMIKNGQSVNYTIYKWDHINKVYKLQEKVEK